MVRLLTLIGAALLSKATAELCLPALAQSRDMNCGADSCAVAHGLVCYASVGLLPAGLAFLDLARASGSTGLRRVRSSLSA